MTHLPVPENLSPCGDYMAPGGADTSCTGGGTVRGDSRATAVSRARLPNRSGAAPPGRIASMVVEQRRMLAQLLESLEQPRLDRCLRQLQHVRDFGPGKPFHVTQTQRFTLFGG